MCIAMPFSSRVKRDSEGRDNQAFLVENVFLWGGGGGLVPKKNPIGRSFLQQLNG